MFSLSKLCARIAEALTVGNIRLSGVTDSGFRPLVNPEPYQKPRCKRKRSKAGNYKRPQHLKESNQHSRYISVCKGSFPTFLFTILTRCLHSSLFPARSICGSPGFKERAAADSFRRTCFLPGKMAGHLMAVFQRSQPGHPSGTYMAGIGASGVKTAA